MVQRAIMVITVSYRYILVKEVGGLRRSTAPIVERPIGWARLDPGNYEVASALLARATHD